jgi:hypothetical protein
MNVKKILIRGGSIASGHGVSKSFVDILSEYYAEQGIEIINRSRMGETTFDAVWTFEEDIAPFKPDILLLHYSIDDAYYPVYRSESKENLVQVVRLARQRFHPAILLATSHTFDNPYDMDAVNIYYRVIREVCEDLACEMVSVHTYWAGYLAEAGLTTSDCVLSDKRYPNEQGHAIIARALQQHLAHRLG